jgi:hypothetical protein
MRLVLYQDKGGLISNDLSLVIVGIDQLVCLCKRLKDFFVIQKENRQPDLSPFQIETFKKSQATKLLNSSLVFGHRLM